MTHCEKHNVPLAVPSEGRPYCFPCLKDQADAYWADRRAREREAWAEVEPDYDLAGKYDRRIDSHLDDPAATALVGFWWWKEV